MALFLPQRWRRQPTGPVRIDYGNPLTRGLVAAYPMWRGSTWVAAGRQPATVSGTRASGVNYRGEWFDLDGSSYLDRGYTLLPSGSSPFTISWYAVAHGVPSFSSVFCTRPTGTSAPFFVIRASDSSGGGNYRLSAGPTIGVTDIPAWRADAGTLPALAVGTEERMLLACAGGTDSRTLADYRLVRNGVDHGTAPQVCSYGSLTSSDEFIGWDGGDGKWDGLLGDFIIWNRALSVVEALEYQAAPYQIYRPLVRRSYFDVPSVGGGATISVPAGSLTLTGNAPTVVATANQWIDVPAGALTLTGYAPTVTTSADQVIQVPAGALTLTGYAPTVVNPVAIAVPAGSLTLTGNAPTIVVNANTFIEVPAGALTLTGYAPTIATTANQSIAVPAGALTLTGYAPTVLGGQVWTAVAGASSTWTAATSASSTWTAN